MDQKVETFKAVRSKVQILDLISKWTNVTERGPYYEGRCPFEGCDSREFQVYQEPGIYACAGCGSGGDIFAFVEQVKKCNFDEAFNYLIQTFEITDKFE